MDIIFIFELFAKCVNNEYDFLVNTPMLKSTTRVDLQLLENQIPFFIFEELFEFLNHPDPFLGFALDFFFEDLEINHSVIFSPNWSFHDIRHFTNLRRLIVMRKYKTPNVGSPQHEPYVPSLTKLHATGVVLVRFEDSSTKKSEIGISCELECKCLLPLVKIKQLVLRIPTLKVYDKTESLIRNVMALEQFHYPYDTQVYNFIDFMDYLIYTDKDVDLLVEKGILRNNNGDYAEIANIFNKLGLWIITSDSNYFGIADRLKKHGDRSWNHAKATLMSVYFKDLWTGTGTVAGIVLLGLTFAQTVCSFHKC